MLSQRLEFGVRAEGLEDLLDAFAGVELGDEELALFLRQLVGRLALHEGGRGEDEFDGFHLLQLRLERLERVDRKARSGDLELRAGGDDAFHVSTVAAQQ